MFQTKFNTTLQMFFIKLNMIFFQKPSKTPNICIFPCTIRHLYSNNVFKRLGKYWRESILQGYSKNHKIKTLFKTEKTTLEFKLPWTVIFSALFLRSFWSCLNKIVFSTIAWTKIHTKNKIYANYKKQLD